MLVNFLTTKCDLIFFPLIFISHCLSLQILLGSSHKKITKIVISLVRYSIYLGNWMYLLLLAYYTFLFSIDIVIDRWHISCVDVHLVVISRQNSIYKREYVASHEFICLSLKVTSTTTSVASTRFNHRVGVGVEEVEDPDC